MLNQCLAVSKRAISFHRFLNRFWCRVGFEIVIRREAQSLGQRSSLAAREHTQQAPPLPPEQL
jgi:hypothetical protein